MTLPPDPTDPAAQPGLGELTAADLPPLVTMGDPRLAGVSAPVEPARIATPAFQRRLALLRVGLEAHGANGIAAPQLGWFERCFVMRDPSGSGALVTWINPEIVSAAPEQVWYWEGCLSVPGYKGLMGRSAAIAVRGLDAWGVPLSREFRGWEAHLFQHEFDHLDGILFPYRAADPRHVVRAEELERRGQWPPDWPAPGARDAPIRVIRPAAAE
jgi:peptide deformylase